MNDLLDALRDTLGGAERFSDRDVDRVARWREERRDMLETARAEAHAEGLPVPSEDAWERPDYDIDSSKLFADIHEADVAHLEPAEAGAEADRIEDEVDRWMRLEAPELYGEVNAGRGSGEARGEPEAPGSAGNAGRESEPVGSPIGGPGQSEAVAERGGAGAGNGARARPGARDLGPDHAVSGATILPAGESRLVDKAGNIRLDNIDTLDDYKQAIRDSAERNGGFLERRRGMVSDAQRSRLADLLGLSPDKILGREIGSAFSDSEIEVIERSLAQSAMSVRDLAAKADGGTEQDIMRFAEAVQRHDMIQGIASQARAEAGRALRTFRDLSRVWTKESAEANAAIKAEVSDAAGRTLFQMQQLAQRISRLDTTGQTSKLVRDANTPGLFDWLQSLFVNALISGPFTHMGYTAAGEMFALFRAVGETSAAAAVGKIREQGGWGEEDYARIGEAPAQLYGMYRGGRNGIKAAWQALKTNQVVLPAEVEREPMLPSMTGQAIGKVQTIPGVAGKIIESPGRLVAALHSFNWTTFYSQSIAGQAFRQGVKEGLDGQALASRVAELSANPTREMIEVAAHDATGGALMSRPDYDSFMGRVGQLTNWGAHLGTLSLPGGKELPLGTLRPLKYIDPFVQIAANIQKTAFGRGTPIALFSKEVRDDLAMKNGGVAFDRTAGRLLAGTGFMIAAGGLAAEGLMNGSGPSDPRQSRAWQRIHGMPHGLTIGNLSFDMLRLGNLGMMMSVAADLYSVAHSIGHEDLSKVSADLVHAFAQNVVDESAMRGPAEIMQAVDDYDRYGDAWIRNFASSFVPFSVGLSQTARIVDPYARDVRTTMDAIKAKIPFVSESLQPRYDIWGQPVPNRDWMGTYNQRIGHDPVDEHLYQLGIYPSLPERRIRGVQLTEEQYADYARMSGRLAKSRLDQMMSVPGFAAYPSAMQITMINRVMESSREQARMALMMHYPDIINQAVAAKRTRYGQ